MRLEKSSGRDTTPPHYPDFSLIAGIADELTLGIVGSSPAELDTDYVAVESDDAPYVVEQLMRLEAVDAERFQLPLDHQAFDLDTQLWEERQRKAS